MSNGRTALVIMILANAGAVDAFCRHPESPVSTSTRQERTAILNIYLMHGNGLPFLADASGKLVATSIFQDVGISVHWHRGDPPKGCSQGVTVIRVGTAPPGAARYALGAASLARRDITVYFDRIRVTQEERPTLVLYLFGYVLTHEIGHVLQGEARHSETGVLKAAWSLDDFADMCVRRLAFTPGDLERCRAVLCSGRRICRAAV